MRRPPPTLTTSSWSPGLLDRVEATVAASGHDILGRLCQLEWEALDAQAVERFRQQQVPADVLADGYETLTVASRFGTLRLRRQVCRHLGTGAHTMPGNALLPPHRGMLITRGLTEWPCLLPQELPFATATIEALIAGNKRSS